MTEHSDRNWDQLIDQYKVGSISDKDRYILEKAALDDPFLFDALEGFSLYQESYDDQNTNESHSNPAKRTKLFSLPRIAAAASLIFLISMVFLLQDKGSASLVEDGKELAMSDQSDKEIPLHTENKVEKEDTQIFTPASKKKKEQRPSTPAGAIQKEENAKEAPKPKTANSQTYQQSEPSAEIPQLDPKLSSSTTRVVEEIDASRANRATDAQLEDDAELADLDSGDMIMSSKKKMNPLDENSIYYVAQPELGKNTFDNLAQELIKERDLKQNPMQTIVIEFSLSTDGMPENFTQIVSAEDKNYCNECGAHAIAILKNSGVWKIQSSAPSGRVRYSFEY